MSQSAAKAKLFFTAFCILFGGLSLTNVIAAVGVSLLDGSAVLPRIFNIDRIAGRFLLSIVVALAWCYPALRKK